MVQRSGRGGSCQCAIPSRMSAFGARDRAMGAPMPQRVVYRLGTPALDQVAPAGAGRDKVRVELWVCGQPAPDRRRRVGGGGLEHQTDRQLGRDPGCRVSPGTSCSRSARWRACTEPIIVPVARSRAAHRLRVPARRSSWVARRSAARNARPSRRSAAHQQCHRRTVGRLTNQRGRDLGGVGLLGTHQHDPCAIGQAVGAGAPARPGHQLCALVIGEFDRGGGLGACRDAPSNCDRRRDS